MLLTSRDGCFFIKNGKVGSQKRTEYQDGRYRCVGRIPVRSNGTCWSLVVTGHATSNGCGKPKYLILKNGKSELKKG